MLIGAFLLYNYNINLSILGWKMYAEIPVSTRDTAVRVHGYARCLNLVTTPAPAEPILETPRVYPCPCQSLTISTLSSSHVPSVDELRPILCDCHTNFGPVNLFCDFPQGTITK